MMGTIITSIGTNGRDYSTIMAWEADIDNAAIYASGDSAVGECYDDSVFADAVNINGGTSVGLASVRLTAASESKHDGTANTGVLVFRPISPCFVQIRRSNCTVEWLTLRGISTAGLDGVALGLVLSDSSGTSVANCLVYDFQQANTGGTPICGSSVFHNTGVPLVVSNCIAWNNSAKFTGRTTSAFGSRRSAVSYKVTVLNCTAHRSMQGYASNLVYGFRGNFTGTIKNCLSTEGETADFNGSYTSPQNNCSSDATAPGTGSLINKSASSQYVSTVVGSEDLHLKRGADAINAGADLGTTPTGVNIDINGRDRDAKNDVWDIGAHEFVPALALLLMRHAYARRGRR